MRVARDLVGREVGVLGQGEMKPLVLRPALEVFEVLVGVERLLCPAGIEDVGDVLRPPLEEGADVLPVPTR